MTSTTASASITTSMGIELTTTELETLVAVMEQLNTSDFKIDNAILGERLGGLKSTAASMRWSRLKSKLGFTKAKSEDGTSMGAKVKASPKKKDAAGAEVKKTPKATPKKRAASAPASEGAKSRKKKAKLGVEEAKAEEGKAVANDDTEIEDNDETLEVEEV